MAEPKLMLPIGSAERKNIPIATGLLDYFPKALAAAAEVSKYGNDKHNPGEPMHHARGKSMDHADCIARHLIDRGLFEPDSGLRHSAFLVWRALALLEEELEQAEGRPLPRAAWSAEPEAFVGTGMATGDWVDGPEETRFEPHARAAMQAFVDEVVPAPKPFFDCGIPGCLACKELNDG